MSARAPVRYTLGACTLGAILVARTEQGVCAIALGDDAAACVAELLTHSPDAVESDEPELVGWRDAVARFVDHPLAPPTLPLDLNGTPFQRRVWAALQQIPVGQTTTYTALAATLGDPGLVRAVGTACAANPIAVLIPCHRVVHADGGLAGYRWGVERKRAHLTRESRANPGPALRL